MGQSWGKSYNEMHMGHPWAGSVWATFRKFPKYNNVLSL